MTDEKAKEEAVAMIKRHLRVQFEELLEHAEFVRFTHELPGFGGNVGTHVVAKARNGERIELRLVRGDAAVVPLALDLTRGDDGESTAFR